MGTIPPANETVILPSAGDNASDSLWERIINMRLQHMGTYSVWKRRGAFKKKLTIGHSILTQYDFSVYISGNIKQYIALHKDNGEIDVYDIASNTSQTILTGFSTTRQVQFAQNGHFLFVFDYNNGQKKIYDFQHAISNDYNSTSSTLIDSFGWNTDAPGPDSELVWRYYSMFCELADGSYTIPLRPIAVPADKRTVTEDSVPEIGFTFEVSNGWPVNRYLIATRYNEDPIKVLQPSTPDLPNGPWFIAKKIQPYDVLTTDKTPDKELTNPLSSFVPITGGIVSIFEQGQIVPNTVTSLSETLIFGGYTIERAVPDIYDGVNILVGRDYANFKAGNDLEDGTNKIKLSLVYQYTDGNSSGIVDSDVVFQDSEANITTDTTLGKVATGSIEITQNVVHANNFRVQLSFFGVLVSSGYVFSGTVSPFEIINTLYDLLSAESTVTDNWDLEIKPIISGGYKIVFTSKGRGTAWNAYSFTTVFSDSTTTFTPAGVTDNPTAGGEDPQTGTPQIKSGNRLQIHPINLLISKIYVLAKDGTDYYLLQEISQNDGRANGAVIYLPNTVNDITSNPTYTSSGNIVTEVHLDNYITTSPAFQNIDIRSQQKIVDNSMILKIVAERFDIDKTVLRYKLLCFTDKNIQQIYLTEEGDSYNIRSEIVFDNIKIFDPEGIRRVMDTTFFKTNDGIYSYSNELKKIADIHSYDVEQEPLISTVYNSKYHEFWFIFGSTNVLVYDILTGLLKQFVFDKTINSCLSAYESIYMSLGNDYGIIDDSSVTDDGSPISIIGMATTRHLEGPKNQVKIIAMQVAGKNANGQLQLDRQLNRLENFNDGSWTDDFTPDITLPEEPLKMFGTLFNVNKRSSMPKLRINMTGANPDGFIEHVEMRHVTTNNIGQAKEG